MGGALRLYPECIQFVPLVYLDAFRDLDGIRQNTPGYKSEYNPTHVSTPARCTARREADGSGDGEAEGTEEDEKAAEE